MVRNYKRKKSKTYAAEDLKIAVVTVQSGCTFREISLTLAIPIATLHDHVSGKHIKAVGHPTILSIEEEELIVSAMEYSAANGWPCDRNDLRNIIKEFLTATHRIVCWEDEPRVDFLKNFETRWSHRLSKRKPEILIIARVKNLSEDTLHAFFDIVSDIYEKNWFASSPERIYNLDETGIVTDR
jgi:hypothetical protein